MRADLGLGMCSQPKRTTPFPLFEELGERAAGFMYGAETRLKMFLGSLNARYALYSPKVRCNTIQYLKDYAYMF